MRQILQSAPAESRLDPVPVFETENRSQLRQQIVPIKTRFSARMKRFDKFYAASALYITLLVFFALIGTYVGSSFNLYIARWFPENTKAAISLGSNLLVYGVVLALAGWAAGRSLAKFAPTHGGKSIAGGGSLFFGLIFWLYLYPSFLSLYLEGRWFSATFYVEIASLFIFALPHVAAYVGFANSRKKN